MDLGLAPDVFRVISDPVRREILDRLADGERAVSDLLRHFDFSQPALSKHLRILREAGLVAIRKAGRKRLYRLRAEQLRDVLDWVRPYERFWSERLDRLDQLLDEMP